MLLERIVSSFHVSSTLTNAVFGAAAAIAGVIYTSGLDGVGEVDESESLMNFSKQGALRCICMETDPNGSGLERRQFCRTCSFEVMPRDQALLTKEISSEEIKRMTRSLKYAAKLARNVSIPASIQDVHAFHAWMASEDRKEPRIPPTQPSAQPHLSR
jgi:hypothetical protein